MTASFPNTRLRRPRATDWSRRMMRETNVSTNDLIWPMFIRAGENEREPVSSMPGVDRLSVDQAVKEAKEARDLGIPCLALFPSTPKDIRSEYGDEVLNSDNLINTAMRAIKTEVPEIGLLADVALDPYTSHGQDGILQDGAILNDETIGVLVQQAVVQAQAGADIIAPSDMMDGRGWGYPSRTRQSWFCTRTDHGIQRQVCICVLRPIPRCRWQFRRFSR